jgi:predicted DNA-binding protein
MPKKIQAFRLSETTIYKLKKISEKTGETKSFILRDFIIKHFEKYYDKIMK